MFQIHIAYYGISDVHYQYLDSSKQFSRFIENVGNFSEIVSKNIYENIEKYLRRDGFQFMEIEIRLKNISNNSEVSKIIMVK